MFQVILLFTNYKFLQSVLNRKIIKNEPHALCYSKMEQLLLQCGEALEHYKVGPMLLQSGAALMYHNVGQMLLQRGTTFLNYKAVQVVLAIDNLSLGR